MKLSPLDIRHMDFERTAMGYRQRHVKEFLGRVAAETEELVEELQALRRTVAAQAAEISELQATELELKRTVIAAERIGNEIKEQARREADLVVRKAKHERIELLREAVAHLDTARSELARLEHAQALVREQLRGQLTAFLAALDSRPAARPAAEDEETEDVIAALKETVAAARREVADDEAQPDASGRAGTAAPSGSESSAAD